VVFLFLKVLLSCEEGLLAFLRIKRGNEETPAGRMRDVLMLSYFSKNMIIWLWNLNSCSNSIERHD